MLSRYKALDIASAAALVAGVDLWFGHGPAFVVLAFVLGAEALEQRDE